MNEIESAGADRTESDSTHDAGGLRHYRAIAAFASYALDSLGEEEILKRALEAVAESFGSIECYVVKSCQDGVALLLRSGSSLDKVCVGSATILSTCSDRTDTLPAPLKSVVVYFDTEIRTFEINQTIISADSACVIISGQGADPYGILGVSAETGQELSPAAVDRLTDIAAILAKAIKILHSSGSIPRTKYPSINPSGPMPQIMWCADHLGKIDYCNDGLARLLGGTASSCPHEAWLKLLHPDDREKWSNYWNDCVTRYIPFEFECRIYLEQTGTYRWQLVRAVPKIETNGGRSRWYGSSTDIHEHKLIENRLREQARELEMVNWINSTLAAELNLEKLVKIVIDVGTQLSGAKFGAYLQCVDISGTANYACLSISGISDDEQGALQLACITSIFQRTRHDAKVVRSDDIQSDARYAEVVRNKDMECRKITVRSYMSVPVVARTGEVLGGMVFGHPESGIFDMDDERLIMGLATQASIAVDNAKLYRDLISSKNDARRQYEQLNAIYATAPIGLCLVDNDLRIVRINEHLKMLVSCDIADVKGYNLGDVLGDAASSLEPLCRNALDEKRPALDLELSWVAPDGITIFWLCSCYPILEPDGDVLGVNTVVQDITDRKRGELELARLGSIVENSYDAIIGKTLDGQITSWNSGAERIYGYTAEEAIGKSISIVIPPDKHQEELDILTSLRNGKHVSLDETVRVSKIRGNIHVSSTLSPIRNRAGEVVGVSTIARDITAKKLAEKKARDDEERMRLILQATRIGTWDWDINTNEVRWSDNMEELHGRSPGNFHGNLASALADVFPEDKPLIEASITDALNTKGDYRAEYRVLGEDGRTHWMEGRGRVIYDISGKVSHMAGVCMDITERKEAEEALKVSETMLRAQTEELAIAHRQKDQFLAMLAHELRNPLAPISNAVQLLKIQKPEQREQILAWAIEVIDRQVWLISRLVDDLLDIARITRGHIELKLQEVDLHDVVHVAAESAKVWFDIKHQAFQVDIQHQPIRVHADPTRLIQVISNLLNNASKFTPEYGRIGLRIHRKNNDAVISVSDNGVGIPGDTLPHVFDLFTQADRSLDRRKGGLGLGLSLVKKLVEMHGGYVLASSPGMGRGSEFTIHIPVCMSNEQITLEEYPSHEDQTHENAKSLRILLVDDNRQSTDAMALLLETLGHDVKSAYNGPDALHIADEFQPEIVFLDIGLPLMDGYEVAKRLRTRFSSQISLIALTGYGPEQDKNRRAEAGFDQYLLKPLSLDTLTSLLIRH